ncbi:DMT family transporter [Hwanghaeella sp.]|uniref:DMT family transporter n=1 Tax=Hwanghaeella sp. TaxID=2605943 RepID=UPI003CCBB636
MTTTDSLGRAPRQTLRALSWMLVATVSFASMHALVRHITQELHFFEVAFFRNFFGVVALLPLFLRYGFAPLRTNRLGLLTLRGVINIGAMFAFFYALSVTSLATVSALSFSAPIFVTILAIFFLGEVVRARRWAAIVIGFAGAMVIIRPGIIEVDFGMLAVLLSSALWAVALIVIKILGRTESSLTITVYMGVIMAPLSLVPALFYWEWPSLEQLAWLAGVGIMGSVAQLTMTEALRLGETSEVMPLDFLKLIWAAAIGYLAFGEFPDLFTWIGGLMIFASATYIAIRESKQRRRAAQAELAALER